MNRRERRAAKAAGRRVAKDNPVVRMNLDELFEDAKTRVRATFERDGGVEGAFVCITEGKEVFSFPTPWSNAQEKAASFAVLRDAFRTRRVERYGFATETWIGSEGSTIAPSLDLNREEGVLVIVVDRDGSHRSGMAKIARSNGAAKLLEWEGLEADDRPPQSWLFELMDTAASDARPKVSAPIRINEIDSEAKLDGIVDEDPEAAMGFSVAVSLAEAFSHDLEHGSPSMRAAIGAVAFSACLAMLTDINGNEATARMLRNFAEMYRAVPDLFPIFGDWIAPPDLERDRVRNRLWAAVTKFDRDSAVAEAVLNFSLNVMARVGGTFRLTHALDKAAEQITASGWPPPNPDQSSEAQRGEAR